MSEYDNIINADDMEEFDNVVVMQDEDGNVVAFQFIDLIEYAEKEYVVLLPCETDDELPSDEVVILELVVDEDGNESYVGVADTDVLNAVFEIFKERFSDDFDFVD